MNYLILVALFSLGFSSGQLLGGWTVVSPDNKSVLRIAGVAVSKSNENGVVNEVMEICKAKTQLVAGMNYKISMIIKNKGSSDDSSSQYCTFKAYERAWENFLEVEELSCNNKQKSCVKGQ